MGKNCTKCGIFYELTEFFDDRRKKDGKQPHCKKCQLRQNKKWQKNNQDLLKKWRENNKESRKEYMKKWRLDNADKRKLWSENNKKKRNRLRRLRNKTDNNYRTTCLLRSRFTRAVERKYKVNSVIKILGCSIENFNKFIESKFSENMSWENKGNWHFDHIIPCSHFDLTKFEEQVKCFHYTNFQPLWGPENLQKNDTLPEDFNLRKWDDTSGWIIEKIIQDQNLHDSLFAAL